MFRKITPTTGEAAMSLPGDDIVPDADVVMNRAFTLQATPDKVWPWFMQLGKNRAGWYLPSSVERYIPRKKRALHHIEPSLQNLEVGKIIDDWGGRDATFEVVAIDRPHALAYKSKRGSMAVSWAITLHPQGAATRVIIRLRLSPVKHKWLASSGGELIDLLTIAGLEAGLRQRLAQGKT